MSEKYQIDKTESSEFTLRDGLGYFLVFVGLVISFWLFFQLHAIYKNPKILKKYEDVLHHPEKDLSEFKASIGEEDVKIIIPSMILNFLIPFGILMIGMGIASTLISGGVNLLYGDSKKILFKLNKLEYKMRSGTASQTPMDEIKETLGNLKDKVKELKRKKGL